MKPLRPPKILFIVTAATLAAVSVAAACSGDLENELAPFYDVVVDMPTWEPQSGTVSVERDHVLVLEYVADDGAVIEVVYCVGG